MNINKNCTVFNLLPPIADVTDFGLGGLERMRSRNYRRQSEDNMMDDLPEHHHQNPYLNNIGSHQYHMNSGSPFVEHQEAH